MSRPRLHGLRSIADRFIGHRGRIILGAGAWSLAAKACAALNVFVAVPFVLRSLGERQFGAWAALVALPFFAGFLDFGFGYGAMNLIASAHGRNAPHEIRAVARASRAALIKVAIVLALIGFTMWPFVPWFRVLGLDAQLARDASASAAIVLASIACAIPLNVSNRLQLGVGKGVSAFRWQAIGQLLALVAVVACSSAGLSLPAITAAATLTPLLASAFNTIAFERALRTQPSHDHLHLSGQIWREGWQFFVIQMAAALAFSADLPLITSLRDASEAGTYAIVQRLYSVVPMALSLLWAPLWPIYRQALAVGDRAWVGKTLRRSIAVAVLFAAAAAAIITLAFDPISRLWIGYPLPVGRSLLMGFAAWCVFEAAGTAVATFLNAASYMRVQVIAAIAFTILCVAAKVFVLTRFGIDELPWATIVTYALASMIPLALLRRRIASEVSSTRF